MDGEKKRQELLSEEKEGPDGRRLSPQAEDRRKTPFLQVKAHYQISWRKSGPAYEEEMLMNDLSWDVRYRVALLPPDPLPCCPRPTCVLLPLLLLCSEF